MANMENNSWDSWGRHVLKELESNETDHRNIMDELAKIRTEIATLKVKSGMWGAIAGAVPVLITLLILLIKGHL